MSLGDMINGARVKKQLGLRALARDLDIVPSYLSDIENDRRVPSEAVLRAISERLDLDFDTLMQLAGRLGEDAERYLRRHELAGQLFRRIAKSQLDEKSLREIMKNLDHLDEKGDENEGIS